ncbi:MAG: cytochrome P450 [Beijerinckiaceae bacterium]
MRLPATQKRDDFDLRKLDQAFYDDPYPVYRRLREETPIRLMPDGSYLLTRYRDLVAVYRDTTTFSSDKRIEFLPKFGNTPTYAHHTTSLVFNDPPLHTQVRRLISAALTPRAIADMEPGLLTLVDDLLEAMAAKQQVDLIDDFAAAIPIEVIGNLLAVPRHERGPLRGWSLAILGALEPSPSLQVLALSDEAVVQFLAYLTTLVTKRREHPGDPARDVLTRLIAGEANGDQLTAEQLLHNCIFLLNAGHETTTNLIGNGLELLSRFPQQRERLIADPSLIQSAVEEFLRYESSNQLGNRMTAAATRIGDCDLPTGTRITLCIGAANRDPEQFADPEALDIARAPNRHLAFGGGPHVCAGLSLARLEAQIAISRFLLRFPEYRLLEGMRRGPRARFRGFTNLPAQLF